MGKQGSPFLSPHGESVNASIVRFLMGWTSALRRSLSVMTERNRLISAGGTLRGSPGKVQLRTQAVDREKWACEKDK